jgi:hypothetical protein
MLGYTMKTKYVNLMIFIISFSHLWQLKTSKITFLPIYLNLNFTFDQISRLKKNTADWIPLLEEQQMQFPLAFLNFFEPQSKHIRSIRLEAKKKQLGCPRVKIGD